MRLCLLETSEPAPIKFHQYDCPHVSSARTAPLNMPNWIEKGPQDIKPTQKSYMQMRKSGSRRGTLIFRNKCIYLLINAYNN